MDTVEPTDQELVDAYRKGGHSQPISELFVRHLGKVRGMMYQMTLNHADADDLTQEVFETAMQRLGDLREAAAFPGWLLGIARHAALDAKPRSRSC